MLDILSSFSEAMIRSSAATGYDVQFMTEGIFRYYHELLVLQWEICCADWECGAQISF
jgi:hypothetical protein